MKRRQGAIPSVPNLCFICGWKKFPVRCEVQLKNFIRDQVHRHPSVGKTIK